MSKEKDFKWGTVKCLINVPQNTYVNVRIQNQDLSQNCER